METRVGIRIEAKGVQQTKAQLDNLSGSMKGLSAAGATVRSAMAGLSTAFLPGITLAGMAALVRRANDGVAKLKELRDATGASVENLSALEDIAERTGTSLDTAGKAVIKLNQALNTAAPGSNQAKALEALGLSVENLRKLDPAEALRQVAVAMGQFAEDGEKARAAQFLFGEEIRIIAPLLKNLGVQGEYVAKVTTEQALAAEKFNNELASLGKSATDAARQIAGPLVSSLNSFFDALNGDGGLSSALNRSAIRGQIQGLESDMDRMRPALEKALAELSKPYEGGFFESLRKSSAQSTVNNFTKLEAAARSLRLQLEELEAPYSNEGRTTARPSIKPLGGGKPAAAAGARSVSRGPSGPGYGPMGPFPLEAVNVPFTEAARDALRAIESTDIAKIQRLNAALDELLLLEAGGGQPEVNEAIATLRAELDALGPTAEKVAEKVTPAIATISDFAQQAGRNIQDALGDTLTSALGGSFDSIGELWTNMLTRMVAEAAAAQLNRWLFGEGIGTGTGFVSAIIAGARANGGPVSAGSAYLVGERGPEIFAPRSSGTIIPNGALGGGGVTVNVINQGRAAEVQSTTQRRDSTGTIIDVVLREVAGNIRSGGAVAQAMAGTFGVGRVSGAPRMA